MTHSKNESVLSRRQFLAHSAVATLGGLLGLSGTRSAHGAVALSSTSETIPIRLPDLPYAYDALEPVIDARTMEIHHSRHHAAYARNVATALESHPAYAAQPLEVLLADIPALPADLQTTVRNNGGGHWNHNLFWEIMSPTGGGEPAGRLAEDIEAQFGGFESFKSQFARAAAGRFGSGWAWLIVNEAGELAISSTPNQDNPLMKGVAEVLGTPILGLDVWEHAYYLKYQNRRGDYIDAWWDVVNWPQVDALYRLALG